MLIIVTSIKWAHYRLYDFLTTIAKYSLDVMSGWRRSNVGAVGYYRRQSAAIAQGC